MALTDSGMNRRSLLAFAAAVTASGTLLKTGVAQDADATPTTGIQAGDTIPPEYQNMVDTDWLSEGRNLAQDRKALGSSISSETVNSLQEAWTLDVNISAPYGALVSNPIIWGEKLFLQDANSNVYALNKETGEPLWENIYEAAVPSGGPNGIGVGYGVIAYPVGNGEIIAADPETGAELWRVDITGPAGEGVCMAPLVYDNKVWVSTTPASTAEWGTKGTAGKRGMINVLDVTDGSLLWYFDTTTDNLWGHPTVNGGGGLWHPPAVNSDGEMFYAIGNIYPYPGNEDYPNATSRLGNHDDYANNVLRIDNETGTLIWNQNITGVDIFDLDTHLVVTGTVDFEDGYSRELVFASGKHGYVVALDPDSGAQHWRTPVGTHRNAHLQQVPEGETVEVWPGTLGGVETPFAYADNVVYTAILELPTTYSPTGVAADGFSMASGTGALAALDARDGSKLWEIEIVSGALAAATVVNDLVLTGTLDGMVRAYSTVDGSLVWSAQSTAGLNAPLAISGDYLYVPAGGPLVPSAESEDVEVQPRLTAYKLS